MATVKPAEYADVLETVRHWPAEARLGLLRDVVNSLESQTAGGVKRGRPVEELIGLGAGEDPPPNDQQVRQWIDEYRAGKHG